MERIRTDQVSPQDLLILRELARKQLEYSQKDENRRRIREWTLHNDGNGGRPMIHLELGTFAHEIIPQRLRCEGSFARQTETALYENFLNQQLFDDDKVTPDFFGVRLNTYFTMFGLDVKTMHVCDSQGHQGLGHHFAEQILDLEQDYEKLGQTEFGADPVSTGKRMEVLSDIFGDILPVKLVMDGLYSVPTQMLVHLMSMETMMFSMYDYPELFKQVMKRIAEDTFAYYDFLAEHGYILPTVGGEGLGQGTWCYTQELPGPEKAEGKKLTSHDVWGFMDSQETVGISPQMFEEFIFPCYREIAGAYGKLSYGCCEPVDPIWDRCLSRLPNLRKVSVSPWCNEDFMGERLRGSKIIYHRKPNPTFLGVGAVLDEERLRSHIRRTLKAARGCQLEITQRDVYTIGGDIAKAKRYVDIIKEEIQLHWQK